MNEFVTYIGKETTEEENYLFTTELEKLAVLCGYLYFEDQDLILALRADVFDSDELRSILIQTIFVIFEEISDQIVSKSSL